MGTYCDPDDVAAFLQTPAFTTTGQPTSDDVELLINGVEARIDDETGHAWRARRNIQEYSTARIDRRFRWTALPAGYVQLEHWAIRPLVSPPDVLEVWNGSVWTDWLTGGQVEGRGADYFLLARQGRIYFLRGFSFWRLWPDGVRVTYRYGETEVWGDVHQLAVKAAAAEVLRTSSDRVVAAGGLNPPEGQSVQEMIAQIDKEVEKKLADPNWLRTPRALPYITGGPRWG
ncbi:MAG: hypothetical protein V3U45_08015 [bacterium]